MATVQPGKDCWYDVRDPRERKKIQDRLAQRARRRRLSETNSNKFQQTILDVEISSIGAPETRIVSPKRSPRRLTALAQVSESSVPEAGYYPSPSSSSDAVGRCDTMSSGCGAFVESPDRSPLTCATFARIVSPSDAEKSIVLEIPLTVFSALFHNGRLLGLSCACTVPSKSAKCGNDVPQSLHPTAMQLITIHQPWIDRFPFPKMRDNVITLHGIVDEEEFLEDLFSMASFRLKPGRPSWDPAAWVIEKDFSRKWGYLFYSPC